MALSVAYAWYDNAKGRYELRAIESHGDWYSSITGRVFE